MAKKEIAVIAISVMCMIAPYILPTWPCLFFFTVPVFYLLYSDLLAKNIKTYHFIIFALLSNIIAMIPALHSSILTYIIAVSVSSLYLSAVILLSRFTINMFKSGRFVIFIPAFFWIFINIMLDFHSMAEAPYNVGVHMPLTAPLIWHIGSAGITFLIILFNSAIAYAIAKKDKQALMSAMIIPAVFALCFAYSITKDPASYASADKPIKVALIQGNMPESWDWSQRNPYVILERYDSLTKAALSEKPDLVIWPEYAIPLDIVNYNEGIRSALKKMIAKDKTEFLIGSIFYNDSTKLHEDVGLYFNKEGGLVDSYSSVSPAPFNIMTASSEKPRHTINGAGITVCWEELDRNLARSSADMGAQYLISLANNQDLNFTWFHDFTAAYSKARAAENKRFLVRVTNTGVTQIIDPMGRVIKRLENGKSGFLIGEIYPITEKTFYTQYGDVIVNVAMVMILGFGMVLGALKHLRFAETEKCPTYITGG